LPREFVEAVGQVIHRLSTASEVSGDPGVMQNSSFCIDFGLGFGARYAKYAMYFKGRDEF
jgi:hypothetical protein